MAQRKGLSSRKRPLKAILRSRTWYVDIDSIRFASRPPHGQIQPSHFINSHRSSVYTGVEIVKPARTWNIFIKYKDLLQLCDRVVLCLNLDFGVRVLTNLDALPNPSLTHIISVRQVATPAVGDSEWKTTITKEVPSIIYSIVYGCKV